jgi:NADH-quinone oxidoreductase subunit N
MFKDLHGTIVYKGVHFYDFGCDDSVMYPLDFTFFSCNQDVYHLDSLALIVQIALYYFKSIRSIYEHDLGVFVANPCFSNVPNTCHIIDDNFFSILGFFSSEVFLLVASCVLLIFCVFQVKKNVFRLIFWLSVFFLISTLVILFSKSVVFSLCYRYQFFFSSFHLWFKIFFLVLMLIYLIISYFYFLDEKSGRPYFFVTYFFFLLFSFIFCMCADFIVFYVGLEGLSFVLYFILGQAGYRQRPMEALFKYFFLSGFSSNIILFGILLIYLSFGSVNFFDLYWLLVNLHSTDAFSFSYYIGFLVLFVGFFFKLGIVPFHVWMSDVYEGLGNHVTLFLATINKLVMVFAVLYLVYFFRSVFVLFQDIFLIFGFLTVGLGIICAYYETNIRKIIAYSSIVTLGFLFILYGLFMYYGLFLFVIYFLFYVLVVFTFFVVLIGIRERSKGFVLRNI